MFVIGLFGTVNNFQWALRLFTNVAPWREIFRLRPRKNEPKFMYCFRYLLLGSPVHFVYHVVRIATTSHPWQEEQNMEYVPGYHVWVSLLLSAHLVAVICTAYALIKTARNCAAA